MTYSPTASLARKARKLLSLRPLTSGIKVRGLTFQGERSVIYKVLKDPESDFQLFRVNLFQAENLTVDLAQQ
ncbi:MAG: hypothetical protein ACM37W_09515 [Actinomycetota bacterium]